MLTRLSRLKKNIRVTDNRKKAIRMFVFMRRVNINVKDKKNEKRRKKNMR
jgi:hypothetical protein